MLFRPNLLTTILLSIALFAGCSERSPSDPDDDNGNGNGNGTVTKDAAYWTGIGWDRYADADFSGARTAFYNALDKDSVYSEALSGAGWSDLELGFSGLALREFKESMALDSTLVENYYGAAYMAHTQALTFPNQARDRFEDVLLFGLMGLERGGDSFVFSHNGSVNTISMRVLLARASFGMGEYQDAHEMLDILDPDNDVLSSSPTYIQELLLAIEGLEDLLP